MDADKMSPAQLRELADHKENDVATQEGFLKEGLYWCVGINASLFDAVVPYDLVSHTKMMSLKELAMEMLDSIFVTVPRNTRFICFEDEDSSFWYDDIGIGIEDMTDEWAQKNLRDIRNLN